MTAVAINMGSFPPFRGEQRARNAAVFTALPEDPT